MTIAAGIVQLDGLLFFDAAMRRMSFAGAAQELNVTASAVSQRIKSLEQALGVTLFERRPHGLAATEAARLYLLEIRPALERLRTASARVASRRARRPAKRGRQLSVDMLPALATARVAPLLRSFAEHFPDIELRLTCSAGLSDPARDGFDCCVRYGPGGWPGVKTQLLSREQVFPVCAPTLIRMAARLPGRVEIAQLPLIHDLMPIGWPEWFASQGTSIPSAAGPVFSDSAIAQRAAVEGLGAALGRSVLVARYLAAGRLLRLSSEQLPSPFAYWLVSAPGRTDTVVELFSEWMKSEVFGAESAAE